MFEERRFPIILGVVLVTLAGACRPAAEPADLIIRDVDVLSMESDAILEGRTVIVRKGRIAAIQPEGEPLHDRGPVVDGRGKFLIPGLFDTHVHFNESEHDDHLVLYLAHGVTTVQSMHGSPEHLAIRARVASGELLGPRVLTTGPTTAREGVDSPEKAERLAREQKAAGYDAIKMYGDGEDGMTRETYARLLEAARNEGIRVVGHAPRNLPFSVVIEERQDSIDHMEEIIYTHEPLVQALSPLIDVQFGRIELEEAREAVERYPGVRQRVAPETLTALAAAVRQADLAVTPTLVAFETILGQTTDAYADQLDDAELATVSPITREMWGPRHNRYRTIWADRLEPMRKILGEGLKLQKMLVRAFHAAGVPIMTGSDAPLTFVYPGSSLHRELELLVECGMSPYEALRAATVVPAQELGLANETGTITVGKSADLVLLEANPLQTIGNTRRIAGVVARGRWLPKSDLDRHLGELADSYEPEAQAMERLREPLDRGDVRELVRVYRSLDLDLAGSSLADFIEDQVNGAGYELLGEEKLAEAIELFELNAETFPRSANAWDSLGEAHLTNGDVEAAAANYRKALELEPGNAGAERMLEWLRTSEEAAARPVDLAAAELLELAGDYGPRHLLYHDGALHYRRDEVGQEYRLRALARNLFALEGRPTFRLRFERDATGRPIKVVGLYADGRTDESPRD